MGGLCVLCVCLFVCVAHFRREGFTPPVAVSIRFKLVLPIIYFWFWAVLNLPGKAKFERKSVNSTCFLKFPRKKKRDIYPIPPFNFLLANLWTCHTLQSLPLHLQIIRLELSLHLSIRLTLSSRRCTVLVLTATRHYCSGIQCRRGRRRWAPDGLAPRFTASTHWTDAPTLGRFEFLFVLQENLKVSRKVLLRNMKPKSTFLFSFFRGKSEKKSQKKERNRRFSAKFPNFLLSKLIRFWRKIQISNKNARKARKMRIPHCFPLISQAANPSRANSAEVEETQTRPMPTGHREYREFGQQGFSSSGAGPLC